MRSIFTNAIILGVDGRPSTPDVWSLENGSTSMDAKSRCDCLIINNDVIEFVGNAHDDFAVKAFENARQGSETQTYDLQGRTLLPGLIDGHMHLLLYGAGLAKISIEHCTNFEQIQSTIREAAKARPDAKRLFCRGWMHFMTDGVALARMLDGLDEQNRPIFIDSKDLHSSWCNTPALLELGVQNTPDPVGGCIHRDEAGNPSGLISEAAAVNIVWPHVAKVASLDEKLTYVRNAVKSYNSSGYTGMIEMAMDENGWTTMLQLRELEPVPIRLAAYWIILPSATDEENFVQVDKAIQMHEKYNSQTSPDFRIAGIKVICDGIVDACTAALTEPYSANGQSTEPLWQADKLLKAVQRAVDAGLQVALHAIGDAAVKLAVDTLETVGTTGKRHRIEHLEVTSPEDARRLGELGITASIQAVHADPAILRAWPRLIGKERTERAFAYQEFHEHGAPLALGTDAPTAPNIPWHNFYTATTRRSARDPSMIETVNKHFALSLATTLAAASKGSAYSCFADDKVGSLAPGKKADFIIANLDPDIEQLLSAQVHETWFDGKKVYSLER